MIKAVLLDIDGTLVDSNAAHAATWSAASALFGYDKPASFFQPLIGMGGDRVLPLIDPALSDGEDPGKAITAERGGFFRKDHLPGLRATPGAKALVEHMHGLGLRCIIASSTNKEDLDALLDVAGIRHLIDASTTAEDAEQTKPAPDIVAAALQRAGVDAHETVMIGDTPYDIESAHGVSVPVIALRCGGWKDADLAGAAGIYDDPADLLANFDQSPLANHP